MLRRPPRSTRTDTRFPYPPLFRSWAMKTRAVQRDFRIFDPAGNVPHGDEALEIGGVAAAGVCGIGLCDGLNPQGNFSQPTLHHARSEEHTSELQSLMRISYAVFCLQKKTTHRQVYRYANHTS